MPPINNAAATINVAVQSNAATALPQQVTVAANNVQRYFNQKPFKIRFDTSSLNNVKRLTLPLGQMGKDANEFEKSMQAATGRVVAFGAAVGSIYAIQRAMGLLITTSIDVEHKLKQIQVISNGTSADFQKFSKGIFDVGRQTSTSFKDASDAALEFARQGLSLSEQLKRTRDAMTLVKISGVEVGQSVSSITAALNTFNKELRDSTDLVDRLTSVDNAFAVSATDLTEGLSRVGNSAQEAGVSLNETLGAITALQQRTARGGSVIGNALKSIFTRVGRADNVELLNSLGVATETVSGKTRDAIDILKDLAGVYKNLGDEQKKQVSSQIAGLYQINQFQALIKDLGSSYSFVDQAAKQAADSQGMAAKRLIELNKTVQSELVQSGVNLTQLASSIGKLSFENPLRNFLSTTSGNDSFLTDFNKMLSKIGTEAETNGGYIANALLKGVGNFISGPGVIFLLKLITPIFRTIGTFVGEIFHQNIFVSQSMKEQVQLQGQINAALGMASAEDRLRVQNAVSLNQQLKIGLDILKAQQAAAAQMAAITPLTAGLYRSGVRAGRDNLVIPRNIKTISSGYNPLEKEMHSVQSNPDYANHRSAKPRILQDFSIGGRRQSVVVNSAEKIVPTRSIYPGYAGPDSYSILNPRQQKMMGFGDGYTPNLARGGRKIPYKFRDLGSRGIANIDGAYNNARDPEYYGRAYEDYNNIVRNFSNKLGVSPEQFATVFSKVSPSNAVERNILDTISIVRAHQGGYGPGNIKTQTYDANKRQAFDVLRIGKQITGIKRTAFADNILNPFGSELSTVDFRALGVYGGRVYTPSNVPKIGPKQNQIVQDAYSEAARMNGVRPLNIQAATWTDQRLNNARDTQGFNRTLINQLLKSDIPHFTEFERLKNNASSLFQRTGPEGLFTIPRSGGYVPNLSINAAVYRHYYKQLKRRLRSGKAVSDLSGYGFWDNMGKYNESTTLYRGTKRNEIEEILKSGKFTSQWEDGWSKERGNWVTASLNTAGGYANRRGRSLFMQDDDLLSAGQPYVMALRKNLAGPNMERRINTSQGDTASNMGISGSLLDSDIRTIMRVDTTATKEKKVLKALGLGDIEGIKSSPSALFNGNLLSNGYTPNLAEAFKLSSGAIIDPSKKYLYSDITKRESARKFGYESLTPSDLIELSQKRNMPFLKIIDPSNSIRKDLSDNGIDKLSSKLLVTSPRGFDFDKFQETQVARFGQKSVELSGFTGGKKLSSSQFLRTLQDVKKSVGGDFFIKGKDGYGGKATISSREANSIFGDYYLKALRGYEGGKHIERYKELSSLKRSILSNPDNFFVQQGIRGSDQEYRVTVVGTSSGSKVVGVHSRAGLNNTGDSYDFSSGDSKGVSLSGRDAQNATLKAMATVNRIPAKHRVGRIFGVDALSGGVVELNASQPGFYPGSLDNTRTNALAANELGSISQKSISKLTKTGLNILNYGGSSDVRERGFSRFNKSLEILKQTDEVAYHQIAANLGRAGFGIEVGGKILNKSRINKYFKARGFAGGYAPNINDAIAREAQHVPMSDIYVSHVKTPRYEGPVVANRRDEPTRNSLLVAANGRIPNLASNSDVLREMERQNVREGISRKVSVGSSNFSKGELSRITKDAQIAFIKQSFPGVTDDRSAINKLREISSKAKQNTAVAVELQKRIQEHSKAQISSLTVEASENRKKRSALAEQIRSQRNSSQQSNLFAKLNEPLQKRSSFGLLFSSEEKILNREVLRQGINPNARNLAAVKPQLLSSLRDRRRAVASQGSLVAGIAGPTITGFIDASKAGQTSGGRLASGIIGGAGAGAAVGGFFGPIGLGVGAGVGALAGGISAGINEPAIKREKEFARRMEKVEKQKKQTDLARQALLGNAKTKDLIESGASSDIVKANIAQTTALRAQITKPGLSNIFNSKVGETPEDEIERQTIAIAKQEMEDKKKERYEIYKAGVTKYASKLRDERDIHTANAYSEDHEFVPSAESVNKRKDILEEAALSASERTDFKLSSKSLGLGLSASTPEQMFSTLRQNFKANGGTDEEFSKKEEKLRKDYLKDLEGTGDEMYFLREMLVKEVETQKIIEEAEQKRVELLKQTINSEKEKFNISQILAKKEMGNFAQDESGRRNITSSRFNLNLNSAFITEEEKAKRETMLGLKESQQASASSRRDILLQGASGLTAKFTELARKSTNPKDFTSSFNKLAEAGTPQEFNKNLDDLISQIPSVEKGKDQESVSNLAMIHELQTLRTSTNNQLQKLNITDQTALMTAKEQLTNIKKMADQQRILTSLGGIKSLGKESSLLNIGGTPGSAAAYQRIREINASRGLVGETATKNARSAIDLGLAQSNVSTADLGETMGLTGLQMEASGAVNFDEIKRGRASSLRNSQLDKARSLAQNFLSSNKGVGGNLNLQDRISQAKTPEEIQKILGGFGISNPDINKSRKQTLAQIGMFSDAYKESDKKANDEVNAQYKLGKPSDDVIDVNVTATKENTDAIRELTKKLDVSPTQKFNTQSSGDALPDVDFTGSSSYPSVITSRSSSKNSVSMRPYSPDTVDSSFNTMGNGSFANSYNFPKKGGGHAFANKSFVKLGLKQPEGYDASVYREDAFGEEVSGVWQSKYEELRKRPTQQEDFDTKWDKAYRVGEVNSKYPGQSRPDNLNEGGINGPHYVDDYLTNNQNRQLDNTKINANRSFDNIVDKQSDALQNINAPITVNMSVTSSGENLSNMQDKLAEFQAAVQESVKSLSQKILFLGEKTGNSFPPQRMAAPSASPTSNGVNIANGAPPTL